LTPRYGAAALKYFSTGAHYFMRITLALKSLPPRARPEQALKIRIEMVKTPRDPLRGRPLSLQARTFKVLEEQSCTSVRSSYWR
jgi:hypothetical protein